HDLAGILVGGGQRHTDEAEHGSTSEAEPQGYRDEVGGQREQLHAPVVPALPVVVEPVGPLLHVLGVADGFGRPPGPPTPPPRPPARPADRARRGARPATGGRPLRRRTRRKRPAGRPARRRGG